MIQTFFIWNVIYSMVFIGVFLFISILVLLRHNKMMNKEKYTFYKTVPVISILCIGCVRYYRNHEIKNLIVMNSYSVSKLRTSIEETIKPHIDFSNIVLWLSFIWIIVSSIMLAFLVAAVIRYKKRILISAYSNVTLDHILEQCKKHSTSIIRRNIRIYYNPDAIAPFSFGILYPTIILPSKATEHLETIVKHEFYHCTSGDTVLKLAIEFVRCMQWMNPMIYVYIKKLDAYRELACDELVIENCTEAEVNTYAKAIIQYALRQDTHGYATLFSDESLTERRIKEMIFHPKSQNHRKYNRVCLTIVAIVCVFCSIIFFQYFKGERIAKTIRVNYGPEMEQSPEYEYEEFIDGNWYRGSLKTVEKRDLVYDMTEVTYSGYLYKEHF